MSTSASDDSNQNWFRENHGNSYASMGRLDGYYQSVTWRLNDMSQPILFHYHVSIFSTPDQAVRARKDGPYYTLKMYGAQKRSCALEVICQILGYSATVNKAPYSEIYVVFAVGNVLVELGGDTPPQTPSGDDDEYTTAMASLIVVSEQLVQHVVGITAQPTPTPGSGAATPTIVAETPTPTPAAQAPSLVIDSLQTQDRGIPSATLYYRNPTQFVLRYHSNGVSPAGKAKAIFEVDGAVGTLVSYTQPLHATASGTVRVEMGGTLTPGHRLLKAWIWIGAYHAYASTSFTVFAPSSFETAPNQSVVEAYHICCARVETNEQAQHESYTVHFDPKSYRDEGRQTGYYEAMQLAWPSLSRKVTTVRSDLVSIYGSAQQARAAFQAQVNGYDWAEGGGCGWCARDIQTINTSKWNFGDCCRAAYFNYYADGLDMEETFFVRGQVLVQIWSWFANNDPTSIKDRVAYASSGAGQRLDYDAWLQQQP